MQTKTTWRSISNVFTHCLFQSTYSLFHKTLPKWSLQMHWISVRFYGIDVLYNYYLWNTKFEGNAETFSRHILRIFDMDGNDFLDFKEFLQAIDISRCDSGTVIPKNRFSLCNKSRHCTYIIYIVKTLFFYKRHVTSSFINS